MATVNVEVPFQRGPVVTDEWMSEVAGATILLDKSGNAITSLNGDSIQLGSEDTDPRKIKGINLVGNPAANVFNTSVWVAGSGTHTVRASKLPFIFDSESDARIGASWMIQELATFLKSLENDVTTDALLNQISGVEGRVSGGTSQVFSAADMDDYGFTVDVSTPNQTLTQTVTEWYELVVGRNRAGDKYYTCWVLPWRLWVSTAANAVVNTHSTRVSWQVVQNDQFSNKPLVRYYNNTSPAPAFAANERDIANQPNGGYPALCTRDTDTSVVLAGQGAPVTIWLEPLTLELNR